VKSKTVSIVLALILITAPTSFSAYSVLELHEEGVNPLFSISSVEDYPRGLQVFVSALNPGAVADAVASGTLQTQLSTHTAEGGTAQTVTFSFMKMVRCQNAAPEGASAWTTLPYLDPPPQGCLVEETRLFFLVSLTTLGPGQDLAFGLDPDSLWLIEAQ